MKSIESNIVINKIMASKSSSAIILAESDAEYVHFLAKLSNNYRATFWVNAAHDADFYLALAIAKRVFADDADRLNRLRQFLFCKPDFTKNIIITNEILDYIAALKYNCLLIIDNLEVTTREFDYRAIETLIENCPENLKIVLVTTKFLDLNYSILMDSFPKLITKEHLVSLPIDERIAEESLSREQLDWLYIMSKWRYVDKAFVDNVFPGGISAMNFLAGKYPGIIMFVDDRLVSFSHKLSDILLRTKMVTEFSESGYIKQLYDYNLTESGRLLKALDIAIGEKDIVMIDNAIKLYIEKEPYAFLLSEHIRARTTYEIEQPEKEFVYVRYLKLLDQILNKNQYVTAMHDAKRLISELPLKHPLEKHVIAWLIEAMYRNGEYSAGTEVAADYIKNKIDKYGDECLSGLVEIVDKFVSWVYNVDLTAMVSLCRRIEKFLLDERFSNEYWYVGALQSFIRLNLYLGNNKLAIQHLNSVKKIIPYYVIPYKIIVAYFFVGDTVLAKKTAERIIEESKYNKVTSNLTAAYILLGLIAVYNNKMDEAIANLNEAVTQNGGDEMSNLNAIAIRAMMHAESGMIEYALDFALLYVKRCEITGSNYTSIMHGAVAYCYWRGGEKDKAIFHARRCIIESTYKSAYWLISTAILIFYMLEDENYITCNEVISKFISASKNLGMEVLWIVCEDLISPILSFAETNAIDPIYTECIKKQIKTRHDAVNSDALPRIRFMGATSISIGGRELVWKTKKAKELFLMYILCGDDGLSRDDIIDALWGDYVYVSAINNLKTTNNIIRNTLNKERLAFNLEYSNSRYSLKMRIAETDYRVFKKEFEKAENTTDFRHKITAVNHLITLYKDGFAVDIKVKYFEKINNEIRDGLALLIIKLIKELSDNREYVEAKRFVSVLKKIQPSVECGTLLRDIDKKIFN